MSNEVVISDNNNFGPSAPEEKYQGPKAITDEFTQWRQKKKKKNGAQFIIV